MPFFGEKRGAAYSWSWCLKWRLITSKYHRVPLERFPIYPDSSLWLQKTLCYIYRKRFQFILCHGNNQPRCYLWQAKLFDRVPDQFFPKVPAKYTFTVIKLNGSPGEVVTSTGKRFSTSILLPASLSRRRTAQKTISLAQKPFTRMAGWIKFDSPFLCRKNTFVTA